MKKKRTKIVATLGPASTSEKTIGELVTAGVNAFRLNFSHGTHESHGRAIQLIKKVRKKLNKPVAILQDLSGPKIRVGEIRNPPLELSRGEEIIFDTRIDVSEGKRLPVTYPGFAEDVKVGGRLLLADGDIELVIEQADKNTVKCTVITGGPLTSHKGINYPEDSFNLPAVTEKDQVDLKFGLEMGVDFVALSFVRTAKDIAAAREMIDSANSKAQIIAKIEKHEAINNFFEILKVVDGVMVARGDLGVEIPLERVPMAQKRIIKIANIYGKPVITATQMLRSMVDAPRPTRAEVTDVANAILDGTDALMLSEETASGNYPVRSVEMMSRIAAQIEENYNFYNSELEQPSDSQFGVAEAISHSATQLARELHTDLILCPTSSGFTARMMARFRPEAWILGLTPSEKTFYQLSLIWGVIPKILAFEEHSESLMQNAILMAKAEKLLQEGDRYVVTAGYPFGIGSSTNLIKAGVFSNSEFAGK